MSRFESERALLIRDAGGVAGLCPPQRVAWALVEALGAAVEVRQVPDAAPDCTIRRDGRGRITLPVVSDELVEGLLLLEEIGHYLCHGPYPDPPPVHPLYAPPRELRAARLWEKILEGEVARFVLEAVLPGEELARLRCEADWVEALESTGLEPWKLQARLEGTLRNPTPFPPDPPSWSSWRFYAVHWFRGPICGRFRISARDGSDAFEISCRPQDRTVVELQIFRDLAALTPTEFSLKYGAEREADGEACYREWGR